jgi:predicted glycogen debranching enzyme
VAVDAYLRAEPSCSDADRARLEEAVTAIVRGYHDGTRHRIAADSDGLLGSGVPGLQLTWMDARVGDWVVTPRIGKPVEIQALWINALAVAARLDARWSDVLERARASFAERFWNPERNMLYDVVDCDHQPGTADPSFRPNQIFAVGGLPLALLDGERARAVVDAVEAELWTPAGLRSLAPGESAYTPRYQGGVLERDGSYHQGPVWTWLAGPFIEAWLRVHADEPDARATARSRFLEPLLARLESGGVGHLAEIADAEPPFSFKGTPFQAWSVAEALRIDVQVLAD